MTTEKTKRRPRPIVVLSEEQIGRIMAVAETYLAYSDPVSQRPGLLAYMLLGTGRRISELSRLELEDIDFQTGTVHSWIHKKGKRSKMEIEQGVEYTPYRNAPRLGVDMSDDLCRLIHSAVRRWRLKVWQGPLFISTHGKQASIRTLQYDWERILRESGVDKDLPINPMSGKPIRGCHIGRHTFCTYFADNNPDPYELMRIMGWSDIAMAMTYVHGRPTARNGRKQILGKMYKQNGGDDNAESVREDAGQVYSGRLVSGGGETQSGPNLQLQTPEQPSHAKAQPENGTSKTSLIELARLLAQHPELLEVLGSK